LDGKGESEMSTDDGKKLDRVMRLPEVAGVLGVCARSVRRMSDRGELPPLVHNGRTVGLFRSDVEARLEQMREERGNCPQRSET
jgi:predicted DNA-binding transcriptional regulator AlpA